MKNNKHMQKSAFCLLLPVLSALLLSGCRFSPESVEKTGFFFNTVVTLTVYGDRADAVLEEAFALCEEYEARFSYTLEGSDIWNINHAHGHPVEVHEDTAFLLTQAIAYARLSDGLIDPTVTPLSELWNFTGDPPGPVPEHAQIQELLAHVDYRTIHVQDATVWLDDPDAKVDLGFIAKGYIADQLKAFFLEQGLDSALINLGGNVLAVGQKPDQTPFRIGIQKPFAPKNETAAIVNLNDLSLVSSGSYERYFEQDGVLYHHILNPFTGYPADTDLNGVTILSASSLEGDALSTTCFLLGSQKGQELIESLPGIEALFLTKDGGIYKTSGFLD